MPKQQVRLALARSIQLLIAAAGTTAPQIAKRAGVDPKTMNNLINGRFAANLDVLEKIAEAFNLQAWQLLMPDLVQSLLSDNNNLARVIEAYRSTDATGRFSILTVAEMAAQTRPPGADDKR
jgi:transcriptional regulator with XRE-family HTH domain